MRSLRAVQVLLVAFVTVAVLAVAAPAFAAAGYAPDATYAWVQPGAVTIGGSYAAVQLPTSIPMVPARTVATTAASLPGSAYSWVQPPAEIPAG